MAALQAISKIRKVEIHPLVLFSILDHYLRRQDEDRVVGTLIGLRNGDVIEVTDCFGVTYGSYSNQILIGKAYNKEMLDLYKRVDPKETIVGWYSTSSDERMLDNNSLHIHAAYAEENEMPIHLVVDTSLREDKINFRVFVSAPVLMGEQQALGNTFHQIECEIKMEDDEKLAINQVVKGREFSKDRKQAELLSRINGDETQLIAPIKTLHSMLGTITDYVDQVISGRIPANHEVGMRIAEALKSVPQLDPDSYDGIYNRSTQDLLMVSYLSNLTRTQLAIVEKLTESIPPS